MTMYHSPLPDTDNLSLETVRSDINRLAGNRKILIVDDDPIVCSILQNFLKDHYQTETVPNGQEALKKIAEIRFGLVITDHHMPGMTGLDLAQKALLLDKYLAIILITGKGDKQLAVNAFRHGIADFLEKPITRNALLASIQNALQKRELIIRNHLYQEKLVSLVNERTRELEEKQIQLEEAYLKTISALVTALEARDEYTRGHSTRVTQYSLMIATQLGLPLDQRETLRVSALLHDIGKIGIRDNILQKPGKLTPEEMDHIREHPRYGERILSPIDNFDYIREIILKHHERPDGKGYYGFKNDQIPLHAKIIAVADAFDAMTSHRPYRKAMPISAALQELTKNSGSQFDPQAVNALANILKKDPHIT